MEWRNAARSVAIACAFVLVALAATFPLQRIISYPFVFLFFGAIMASAWMGGAAAGILAVLLSAASVEYFFIPPFFSVSVAKEAQSFLAAFVLCAVVVAMLSTSRKRAERLVRQANERLEDMVRERTRELEGSNREILERERHLRELTEAIPQQIWRANAEGEFEYLNHPLRDYLGEERESPASGFYQRIAHPQDAPLVLSAWRRAREVGERLEIEARLRGAGGVYRWFLIRGNPQQAGDGSIVRWYGIHIDIEEQRRAQQELVMAQEERARQEKNLTMAEMAAAIAHELNQPLTAVVTHAYACREWLRAATPNLARAQATAEKIVQESTRASDVVRRVRALFQKESPECQRVRIDELIEELTPVLREEAIRRNATIQLELQADLPELDVDPVLLRQVLMNLALNGMEAMKETAGERRLTIGSAADDTGEVRVWVEDRGPGVPEDQVEQIFEPFFSSGPDGTGMGLAICRSIVEAHGGRIAVEKAAGGGARFLFSLRANG